jgi:hypothetical protein
MMERLKGKVALVIGAGSVGPGWGNGRAIAAIFAAEGATVHGADLDESALRSTAETIEAAGHSLTSHTCDVRDTQSVASLVSEVLGSAGRIDVLVNVVGGSRHGGAAELSEEEWHGQLDLNLTSVYRACHLVIPHMVEQQAGSIVNLASTSGLRYTGSPQAAYAASKAAIIQFSRVTAVQYAPSGVRVNTVVPGQLHTPMVEGRLAGQRTGGDVEALLAQRLSRIPLGFMGDGRDTAYAALFLASDESRFVTGTEIVVDGGMTARCD